VNRGAILAGLVLAFLLAGMPAAVATGESTVSPNLASLRAASGTTAARAPTSPHLYAPFNGGGIAHGVRIARRASGYCWTTSIGDSRSDAFRCFVGNFIHDPCFANTVVSSNFVLCPIAQPGSNLLRINLTKATALPPGDQQPHAIPALVHSDSGANNPCPFDRPHSI
jgi:hypothetical protein